MSSTRALVILEQVIEALRAHVPATISLGHISVFAYVAKNPDCSQIQIIKALGLRQAHVSRALLDLSIAKRGGDPGSGYDLIEVTPGLPANRQKRYRVSARGAAILADIGG